MHPYAVLGVLSDSWGGADGVVVGVGIGMLTDVETITVALAEITMDFAPPVSYGVDVLSGVVIGVLIASLADVLAVVISGVVTACSIVAGVLTVVNSNVLAADFNFAMPVPVEKSQLFC